MLRLLKPIRFCAILHHFASNTFTPGFIIIVIICIITNALPLSIVERCQCSKLIKSCKLIILLYIRNCGRENQSIWNNPQSSATKTMARSQLSYFHKFYQSLEYSKLNMSVQCFCMHAISWPISEHTPYTYRFTLRLWRTLKFMISGHNAEIELCNGEAIKHFLLTISFLKNRFQEYGYEYFAHIHPNA